MTCNSSETKRGERITVHVDSEREGLIPGFLEGWQEELGTEFTLAICPGNLACANILPEPKKN